MESDIELEKRFRRFINIEAGYYFSPTMVAICPDIFAPGKNR